MVAAERHAPHNFALASGTWPGGLALSGIGLFSGTPETNGLSAIAIAASDVHGCAATNTYSLTILPLPELTILRAGGDVVLSWSTNYPEFQLLCATNLKGSSWATAAPPAMMIGTQMVVTNSVGDERKFYQLNRR